MPEGVGQHNTCGCEHWAEKPPYLARAGAIVLPEAALYLVDGRSYVGEALSVDLLCLGAQSGDGQDLAVLDDALLELAKQDSESCVHSGVSEAWCLPLLVSAFLTCGVVAGPERVGETGHL